MNFATIKKNLLRLYHSYVKKHFLKLVLALILSFAVAGGTAAIAWLLDPAIKKIFMQDHQERLLLKTTIIKKLKMNGKNLSVIR